MRSSAPDPTAGPSRRPMRNQTLDQLAAVGFDPGLSALAALCGAGVGLGLVMVLAGWRGVEVPHPSRTSAEHPIRR
jgi:hypothetical protein